jgi:hypothetical protein
MDEAVKRRRFGGFFVCESTILTVSAAQSDATSSIGILSAITL